MRDDASATAISIALHGLLVLVVWLSASRWGGVVILIPDDTTGPRFEPGAVVPIEVATIERVGRESDVALAPNVPATPELDRADGSRGAPGPARSTSRAAKPPPVVAEPRDLPSEGLLHGRSETAGLLGSGRHDRGDLDPALLRGSRTLYEQSTGVREGPQPLPASPAPPGNDHAFQREGNKWIYREPDGSFTATLRPDGSVDFRNKVVAVKVGSMPAVSNNGEEFITLEVEHDAVALAQLARGRDPSPRAKAQLLAATFEFRLEVATRYHKQRLIDQLGQLDDELDAIWSASGHSLTERKRLLFELWDGCDEPTGELEGFVGADTSALDETRRELASAARRKIIRFIGEVAPAASPEAYTEAELAALNRRRVSEQMFAPYK